MKRVRDFLAGKLRRAEVEDRLTLELEGPPHEALGELEAVLVSARGRAAFYARGLSLESGAALPYEALARVELSPEQDGERTVDLITEGGETHRLHASAAGGLVIHAALRWIGHTILRRKLAD